jgi:hypothetical protein
MFLYYGICLSFILSASAVAAEENKHNLCPTEEKVGHISDIFSEFDDYSYTDEPEQTPSDDDDNAEIPEITKDGYASYIKNQIISLLMMGISTGFSVYARIQENLWYLYHLLT